MRLETEHERQLMEWAELEKERRHQLMLRQNDSFAAQCQLVCCIAATVFQQGPQFSAECGMFS